MEQKLILRNLKLYAWFQALREPLFCRKPVLITYIQQIGRMSLSQIYVMESIVVVAVMLLQIPGGAIATASGASGHGHWHEHPGAGQRAVRNRG